MDSFLFPPPSLPPPNLPPRTQPFSAQHNQPPSPSSPKKFIKTKYMKVMDQFPVTVEKKTKASHAIIFRVLIILAALFVLVAIVFGFLLVRLFSPLDGREQQCMTNIIVDDGNIENSCNCNSSNSNLPQNFDQIAFSLEQTSTTIITEKHAPFIRKEKNWRFFNRTDYFPENVANFTTTTTTIMPETTTETSTLPSSTLELTTTSNETFNTLSSSSTLPTIITESQTYTTVNFEDDEANLINSVSQKRNYIREMLRTEWTNYRTHAFGEDALDPISLQPVKDIFGKQTGSYLVAILSSLWTMNLKEEFGQALAWMKTTNLKANFAKIQNKIDVYLTVTNYIGGLLSAHVLSGEDVFLERAKEVADVLDGAYFSKTGLPRPMFIPNIWSRWSPSDVTVFLPEITATQLEYGSLYHLTGNSSYFGRLEAVGRLLKNLKRPYAGLYLDWVVPGTGQWRKGAEILGGSRLLYSHLIKRYIASGRTDRKSFELFKKAIRALERNRFFTVDPPSGQLLVNCLEDYDDELAFDGVMLVEGCQLGATLGLGARELELEFEAKMMIGNLTSSQQRKAKYNIFRMWELAEEITETCYKQSIRSKSGLPPKRFYFSDGSGVELANFTKPEDFEFVLSPELAESYFTLWRLTHDQKYRDYAWQAVQAIAANSRHPKTGLAAKVKDVNALPVTLIDHQPYNYVSGTLKFLYLTFTEDSILPIDSYIFTSFGQPLPIEKKKISKDEVKLN